MGDIPPSTASRSCLLQRVWRFYYDGFRNMTVGKTLWTLILIKLFILFFVLRLFFFPDFLSERGDDDASRAEYVSSELVKRGQ